MQGFSVMRVARRCLTQHPGTDPGAAAMVGMVTRDAAAIGGLDDHLGQLAVDRPADIAVFDRTDDDPGEHRESRAGASRSRDDRRRRR
jgi:cytosine/adenosine deaminase-related metal-dependent hydrolase